MNPIAVYWLLAAWAALLFVARRELLASPEVTAESAEGFDSEAEDAYASVQALKDELDSVALLSRGGEWAADISSAQKIIDDSNAALSDFTTPFRVAAETTQHPGTSQDAHRSDAYLGPTRSHVPPIITDDVFCDELLNTFPLPFGGDVPVDVVVGWCAAGVLSREDFDHLPGGVEDKYFVPFTILQTFRKVFMASQYVDRVTRFRELLAPMIDAMEKRHDRMLYNYI